MKNGLIDSLKLLPIKQSRLGFSYFELMAGLFILLVIMLPVLFFAQQIKQGVEVNREELAAHCAAFELLEQLRSIPFSDLASGTYTGSAVSDGVAIASSPWVFKISDSGIYKRKVKIEDQIRGNLLVFKKIDIEIAWEIEGNASRAITLSSLATNENP
ncbi:MAG: hypothetical protein HQM08_14180 [Candidatus Riflebacteria bacterium]|nr:hypothetical protein [Candidatus Riflebacteria bacterium]